MLPVKASEKDLVLNTFQSVLAAAECTMMGGLR